MKGQLEVKDDVIEMRIREIFDAVRLIKGLLVRRFEELSTYELLSMRYLIIELVEAAAGICMEVMASMGERPEGYPECFIRMGERSIIPRELAEKLASAARLRNLLVHRYWEIIDEKVYTSAKEGLVDFEEFVRHVRRALGHEEGG